MNKTKIFGIVNITPDSFSDGSTYFNPEKAIARIEALFLEGADFVDIGAQSTAYGARIISLQEEWDRLESVLDKIKNKNSISIDTYNYKNMLKAYDKGFRIFNDVKGGQNEEIMHFIAAQKDITYIAMYSLVIPANKNIRVKNVEEIYKWAKFFSSECERLKIDPARVIIDPGIGFTTNPHQSFLIIKNLDMLKKFGFKILIGHSRKSFLEEISNIPSYQRDLETTVVSLYMYGKADYIRVHNVAMHKRAFAVWEKYTLGT